LTQEQQGGFAGRDEATMKSVRRTTWARGGPEAPGNRSP
jgi:hypothetical protein